MFGLKNIQYHLTQDCLKIYNSYDVKKRNMTPFLRDLREKRGGETSVFKRSLLSLKMEWIAHNFLFGIGYKRSHTKDVDLDNPCDRPEWVYFVFGSLVWFFV